MQEMEMFFVNEAKLWNVADRSQETLLFDWIVLNLNFECLSAVLVWPSGFPTRQNFQAKLIT